MWRRRQRKASYEFEGWLVEVGTYPRFDSISSELLEQQEFLRNYPAIAA